MSDIVRPSFEDDFQQFMREGGLDDTRPVSEDYERAYRRNQPPFPPARCPHGLTRLTCAECGLIDGGWGHR